MSLYPQIISPVPDSADCLCIIAWYHVLGLAAKWLRPACFMFLLSPQPSAGPADLPVRNIFQRDLEICFCKWTFNCNSAIVDNSSYTYPGCLVCVLSSIECCNMKKSGSFWTCLVISSGISSDISVLVKVVSIEMFADVCVLKVAGKCDIGGAQFADFSHESCV